MTTRAELSRRVQHVDDAVTASLAEVDDRAARAAFDALAAEHGWILSALSHRWAPALYRRDRVLFRHLVRAHAATGLALSRDGRWRRLDEAWGREEVRRWLDELDRDDEIELFRRVYWLHLAITRKGQDQWREDVVRRYLAAPGRPERQVVLAKLETWFQLDEASALALYEADPESARPFVLRHLSQWRTTWRGTRHERWSRLAAAAKARGDEDFFFELYRRQTPADEWRMDLAEVARTAKDLDRELQRRQTVHAGDQMLLGAVDVLKVRGAEALPWARRNLFGVQRFWRDPKGYRELRELALERGWLDLWGELVRKAGTAETFDKEVTALVFEGTDAARDRLRRLAGVGYEWNAAGFGLASVHPLSDAAAVALYRRWPDLLRGPFRLHVSGGWGKAYPKLLDAAIDDQEVVDLLASRVVLQSWEGKELQAIVDRLVAVYGALPDDVFARRAAAVLGALPAYGVWAYDALVQRNALARMVFERSGARWLDDPVAVRDLLESPQIQVQLLAFRLLGRRDPRAVVLAADNLDLLLPTLLRPLHRRTRLAALRALGNAAAFDEPTARQVVARARDAFDLPDRRYPKEALLGLIGEALHRWPSLRTQAEAPVIWEAS